MCHYLSTLTDNAQLKKNEEDEFEELEMNLLRVKEALLGRTAPPSFANSSEQYGNSLVMESITKKFKRQYNHLGAAFIAFAEKKHKEKEQNEK